MYIRFCKTKPPLCTFHFTRSPMKGTQLKKAAKYSHVRSRAKTMSSRPISLSRVAPTVASQRPSHNSESSRAPLVALAPNKCSLGQRYCTSALFGQWNCHWCADKWSGFRNQCRWTTSTTWGNQRRASQPVHWLAKPCRQISRLWKASPGWCACRSRQWTRWCDLRKGCCQCGRFVPIRSCRTRGCCGSRIGRAESHTTTQLNTRQFLFRDQR